MANHPSLLFSALFCSGILLIMMLALIIRYRQMKMHFKKKLETLEIRLEQQSFITNSIPAAVMLHSPNGEIIYANPYSEILTGYAPEEIITLGSRFWKTATIIEDHDRMKRAWNIACLGEEVIFRGKLCHKLDFSTQPSESRPSPMSERHVQLWAETHFVPLHDLQGELQAVLSVSVDATSTIRYQQQIEEQNQDLSDFSYMVSHDLKSPIFTIKGMASLLQNQESRHLSSHGLELIEHILQGVKRLESLVSSILEFSALSIKALECKSVSLQLVLANVVSDLSAQIGACEAKINLPDQAPVVIGEPVRLYQVFANIIENALKYRALDRVPHITITCRHCSSAMVAIFIEDNGIGIAQENLQKIFRPYIRAYTQDTSGRVIEGNGIGLAAVKKIVTRLGGSVSVESKLDSGSTFTVILPLASEQKLNNQWPETAQEDGRCSLNQKQENKKQTENARPPSTVSRSTLY